MENKLAVSLPVSELPAVAKPAPLPEPVVQMPLGVDPDMRLVIEEQGETFVYKTVDRRTGEVLQQFPREDIVKMREEPAYVVGHVISTQA